MLKCRKYEDAAISSIQTCSQSADQLRAMAEALSKNKDALNDEAKIAKATARRRHARAPATDCAGFLSLVLESKFQLYLLFHEASPIILNLVTVLERRRIFSKKQKLPWMKV